MSDAGTGGTAADNPGASGGRPDTDNVSTAGNRSDGVGRIDRSPTYLSSGLAVVAGTLTVTTSAATWPAVASGLAGLLGLAVGLGFGRQSPVTVGAGLLVVGVIAAGISGVPVLVTLLGITTALLAYDLATTAIGLGEQLGRAASTAEVELLHAAVSTLVGLGVVVLGFAVHEAAVGNQPASAVLGLLVVVVVLVAALRRSDPTSGRRA
jgi:hypothetical protein